MQKQGGITEAKRMGVAHMHFVKYVDKKYGYGNYSVALSNIDSN